MLSTFSSYVGVKNIMEDSALSNKNSVAAASDRTETCA